MREGFAHPLGPLPWSLANADGTPRTTAKSVLAKHVHKLAPPANSFPTNSATIVDGMSLVHKLKYEVTTFGDLAAELHRSWCVKKVCTVTE